jgi:hypothetical protein
MLVMRATEPGPLYVEGDMDVASAIADGSKKNPLLGDAIHTAALMVVMTWHESRFRENQVGDSGASIGVAQVASFWTKTVCKDDDLADLSQNIDCSLKLLHISFEICRSHPIEDRLAWYAAGGSGCEKRLELSRFRMHQVARLMREHPAVEKFHLGMPTQNGTD